MPIFFPTNREMESSSAPLPRRSGWAIDPSKTMLASVEIQEGSLNPVLAGAGRRQQAKGEQDQDRQASFPCLFSGQGLNHPTLISLNLRKQAFQRVVSIGNEGWHMSMKKRSNPLLE
jgi:hypothetical protein